MSSGSPITPDPKDEKPAPPPKVVEKSVSTSKPTTLMDVLNFLAYIIMVGAGIYYGWKIGRQYAFKYWMTIQMLGQVLREYIAKAIASLRASRAASTMRAARPVGGRR